MKMAFARSAPHHLPHSLDRGFATLSFSNQLDKESERRQSFGIRKSSTRQYGELDRGIS